MRCKKLGVLLAMVLVGVSAAPAWSVSAAETQDLPQQVLDISNGSDEIYGPGAPIEHVENPDERFSSGGVDHTHQYIVSNALKILNNDKGSSILNTKAAMICEYTDWPDVLGNEAILTSKRVEQQTYRSCMGLLKLTDKYSEVLLEAACKKALSYTASPSYKSIKNILVTGSVKTELESSGSKTTHKAHGITRGADYYRR